MLRRTAHALLALLCSSALGTQLLAYQLRYHPTLGTPVTQLGVHRVYLPWAGGQWAWRWGRQHPRVFQLPALLTCGMTALLCWPLARKREEQATGARWATTTDLKAVGLFAEQGIVLGKHGRHLLRHHGPEHVLVTAPTQSGKTTSLVVPTLFSWPGSVLVHDPKEELYRLTAGYRQTISRVVNLHPTSPTSGQYNPLDAIRLGTDYEIRDTQIIADMLVDPEGTADRGGAAQHFKEMAADLHTGLILYGLYTRKATTLAALHRLLSLDHQFVDLLAAMPLQANNHPAILRAVRAATELADRELSAVLSTARRALRLWGDPLVARCTDHSDFCLFDLRERVHPMTLYLTVPFSDQERLRPWTRLVVRQMLDYCTQQQTGWRHRLLGLIDEVPALNRMPVLADGLDFFAGFGVNLCLITPSLNKLTVLYGSHNNFVEGCRYRVVFAPNDDEVASKFSRMTGMAEVVKTREMVAREPFHTLRDRTTTSTETVQQPLLSATALMHLPPAQALLLIGNSYPALVEKARYYQHRQWQKYSEIAVKEHTHG